MSTDMLMSAPTKGPGRVGQGTEIEKARAATQVQAAVYLARQFPRDEDLALEKMLRACSRIDLADQAFYKFPRGKETVEGLTIVAACEIAQIWGNLEYGLNELRRDDVYGQSELMAFAWDLETNVRPTSLFIAPHIRDTKKGSYRVKDARDIYEVVTNAGNRRMRACILKILPSWYVLQAEAALKETLLKAVEGSGKSVSQQVEEAVAEFLNTYGVTRAQLEHKAQAPISTWGPPGLVELRTLSQSLARGEITVEEAFPDARVTAEELAKPRAGAAAAIPAHTDHDPEALDSDCPGCQYDSAAADREAAEQ